MPVLSEFQPGFIQGQTAARQEQQAVHAELNAVVPLILGQTAQPNNRAAQMFYLSCA